MDLNTMSEDNLNSLRIESEISMYNIEDKLKTELLTNNNINEIIVILKEFKLALELDNTIMNYYEEKFG